MAPGAPSSTTNLLRQEIELAAIVAAEADRRSSRSELASLSSTATHKRLVGSIDPSRRRRADQRISILSPLAARY
jgi:hypothetical protein